MLAYLFSQPNGGVPIASPAGEPQAQRHLSAGWGERPPASHRWPGLLPQPSPSANLVGIGKGDQPEARTRGVPVISRQ
jgi:hypothetical protein